MIETWYDGKDNYKENNLYINYRTNQKIYHLKLLDVPVQTDRDFLTIVNEFFSTKNEIMFSGGTDSEVVLRSAILTKQNFKVITLRLFYDDMLMNTHDIYYSEKICRELGVKQTYVDLNARVFFENGDYIKYLEPYNILEPHVATHFYLIDQCDNYPIFGGDYSWPWATKPVISPHRLWYTQYIRYMRDRGINGINSFLNHSLELNLYFMKRHKELFDHNLDVGKFKAQVYNTLGIGYFEPRFRSYGWEKFMKNFSLMPYREQLKTTLGEIKHTIFWENQICNVLEGNITSNDEF
jgi:Queuosine biosynthesis protein QueC